MRFASPNAVSSLHRMGIHAYTQGLQLADLGFDQDAADAACRLHTPVTEEVERKQIRTSDPPPRGRRRQGGHAAHWLAPGSRADRRADAPARRHRPSPPRPHPRSKDATIREIHHRVKNNLQTIAALLRLQGRRLQSPEAQQAIEESERRIRSIAIVHETLSREVNDIVPFADIVQPLVRVVEETVSTPELRLRFQVEGDAGDIPGEIATPLAVVLNELMQNAVGSAASDPPSTSPAPRRRDTPDDVVAGAALITSTGAGKDRVRSGAAVDRRVA